MHSVSKACLPPTRPRTIGQVLSRDEQILQCARAATRARMIVTVDPDGRHYVAFAIAPQVRYFVTLLSCECRDFVRTGSCMHHSHLLDHTGNLPIDPAAVSAT